MPSIDDVFGASDLLKATDLPHGRPAPVVIEATIVRQFDDGPKIELAFRGKRKRLLCNRTNARTIAAVLQCDDFTQWAGRTIFLLRTHTEFQGRQVECVRIDPSPPVVPASQLPQPGQEPAPVYAETPSDPGGYRAETAALAQQPASEDIPF